jgi:peptidoglycan/LPS O-acetylase OafA/YrhL
MDNNKIPEQEVSFHKHRIKSLDSLRGLAALVVVLAHTSVILGYYKVLDISPLHIFFTPHEAVIFFFLLSGYVLVYQYGARPGVNYQEFIVARFFRLSFPYLASLVLYALLRLLFKPVYVDASWIGSVYWDKKLTVRLFFDHLFLITNFATDTFNPVIWSLVHELRFSLIFPVLMYFFNARPIKTITITLLLLFASSVAIIYNVNPSQGYNNSYAYTLYYLFSFITGGVIAKNQAWLVKQYSNLLNTLKYTSVILALTLYIETHKIPSLLLKLHLLGMLDYSFVMEDFLTTLAAAYIIIAAIATSGKNKFLENKVFQFLGKISYSLYLLHAIIISLIYKEFGHWMPMWLYLLISYIVVILVAALFNKYVEQYGIKLSKKMRARFYPVPPSAVVGIRRKSKARFV